MSCERVINHIQKILNSCGDPVIFTTTGEMMKNSDFKLSIEIKKVSIKKTNNCFSINPPNPISSKANVSDLQYIINKIRIPEIFVDDYSKGFPLSDEEMKDFIIKSTSLFGYYD